MKNVLQENMKRFGTKNLTEQDQDRNNNGYPDDTEGNSIQISGPRILEKSDLSNILFDISTLLDSLDNEQLQNTAKLSDADSKLLRKSVDNMLKSLSPVKYLIDTTQLSNG